MSKARELSKLLSGTLKVGALQAPAGTTAQRPSGQVGQIRYNSETGKNETYDSGGWGAIATPPLITTVNPSTYNGEAGTLFTITGSFFDVGAGVKFITNAGVEYTASVVTRVNASQLTATTPQDFAVAQEPLKVKVINPSGLSYTLEAAIDCGGSPSWSTAAGNLATIIEDEAISTINLVATDPDAGASVSFNISSGNLPAGLTMSSSGSITGTPNVNDAYSTGVTHNFDVTATDNAGNATTRSFNIIRKWRDGSSSSLAVAKAADIKAIYPSAPDGNYYINLPSIGVTLMYCNMTADGGGWMRFAYAASVSGMGNSTHMVFHQFGSINTDRNYNGTSYSRFDIARQMSGAGTSSQLMWRRVSDTNPILIHSADQLIYRMPGGAAGGNMNMNGSGSGYPITTMKMSNSGNSGIVSKTNGRYENGPSYPGIAWNSAYNENTDNVGSFSTWLNRRSLIYWETNGSETNGQWFHADPLQMSGSRGATFGTEKKDIEIFFRP